MLGVAQKHQYCTSRPGSLTLGGNGHLRTPHSSLPVLLPRSRGLATEEGEDRHQGGRCSWRPGAHRTDQIWDWPGHLLVPPAWPTGWRKVGSHAPAPRPHRHHPTVPRTGVTTSGHVCGTERGPSVFGRVHRRGSRRPRGPGQFRAESRSQTRHGSYLPGQHRAGHTNHHTTATRPRWQLPSPG